MLKRKLSPDIHRKTKSFWVGFLILYDSKCKPHHSRKKYKLTFYLITQSATNKKNTENGDCEDIRIDVRGFLLSYCFL